MVYVTEFAQLKCESLATAWARRGVACGNAKAYGPTLRRRLRLLHAYQRRQSKNAATSDTAAGVAARDATGASDADATELSPPPASAGVAAKADPAPPASKALRLYTARNMVAWAREVLQMPEHVCNALHEANVDGEDVCSFSNEEWDMLTKEHGLSGLVVRKKTQRQ